MKMDVYFDLYRWLLYIIRENKGKKSLHRNFKSNIWSFFTFITIAYIDYKLYRKLLFDRDSAVDKNITRSQVIHHNKKTINLL